MGTTVEMSLRVGEGGTSSVVSISGTSAQSGALTTAAEKDFSVIVTPTTDCFVRQGANPTAVSDGTDQILLAYQQRRISVKNGNKLAFKTTGATGSVYLTPEV